MSSLLGLIQVTISSTFYFASLSGVNSGIIASLFSTAIPFTSLMFFYKYNQKLSKQDYLGFILIMVCVIFISLGGVQEDEEQQMSHIYVALSIFFALLTSVLFSVNTLAINHVINTLQYPSEQLQIDGLFVFGLFLVPFFIANEAIYETTDIVLSNIFVVLLTLGLTLFTKSLKYGKGGIC